MTAPYYTPAGLAHARGVSRQLVNLHINSGRLEVVTTLDGAPLIKNAVAKRYWPKPVQGRPRKGMKR